MRDEFSKAIKELIAKRVGFKCSNPECRRPTSGPDSQDGSINVGVAAHICAASTGGPRFKDSQSAEQRRSFENGIWLCQIHAKIIDDDPEAYPEELLYEWKIIAEETASLEARGYVVKKANSFEKLEKLCKKLVIEMRDDLVKSPLTRQFILKDRSWSYNPGRTPYFEYYYDDHVELESMMTIMQNYKAITNITFNSVSRYNFREEFVDYLLENKSA